MAVLSKGSAWVSVGPLRSKILMQAAGCAQDVVIAGHDRGFAAALVFPNLLRCRELAGLTPDACPSDVLRHPVVKLYFQAVFDDLARQATGSSTFVARAMLLEAPPSLDAREITDKGSINQKAVLRNRAMLVDELYSTSPPARVIASAGRA